MKKLFGTDGIRFLSTDKIFNNFSLNNLSKSIIGNNKSIKVLIGRDTRESSEEIEYNLTNALKSNGASVFKIGLLTTPAVSYLTKNLKCNLGIVISASHNPYQFNGLKFFDKDGEKLSNIEEKKIEKNFFKLFSKKNPNIGTIQTIKNPFKEYKKNFTKILKKIN